MINFCTQCASSVALTVPAGDNLPRAVCTRCGYVHYENPRLVVGSVLEWDDRILLCRRAIEPRLGFWTFPAGFMENGETAAEGAAREAREEACAEAEGLAAFALVSIRHISQVQLFFRGRLRQGIFSAGDETLEAALFAADDLPWEDLAFQSVRFCLQRYLSDRASGRFGFHSTDLQPLTASR